MVATGQFYWDTEFTQDLRSSMGKTLYVVLDACHAEGLINLWEIPSYMRLNLQVILFSASHSEITTYARVFTPAFVRKAEIGKAVNIIADEILNEINESKIPNEVFRDVSPARHCFTSISANEFTCYSTDNESECSIEILCTFNFRILNSMLFLGHEQNNN